MDVPVIQVVFRKGGHLATINESDFNEALHMRPEAAPDPETKEGRRVLYERAVTKAQAAHEAAEEARLEAKRLEALVAEDEKDEPEETNEVTGDEPLTRLPGESAKAFKARVAAAAKE